MNKEQIQKALQIKKITSTSDLIIFIINQVSKVSLHDPLEELSMRIQELQKPKGLDHIMLEEVKTIAQAIMQQREEGLLREMKRLIHQKFEEVENILEEKVKQMFEEYEDNAANQQQLMKRQYRPSLKQISSQQLFNTNSISTDNNFYNKPQQQQQNTIQQEIHFGKPNFSSTLTSFSSKPLLNSSKQLFNEFSSKQLSQSKTLKQLYHHHHQQQQLHQPFQILFDTTNQTQYNNKLKQTLSIQAKQIQQLKHSLCQLNKSISDKLNLQQVHQILSQFQTQIYQNVQNDKIQLQNIQFTLQKQLQSQILNLKKQSFTQMQQKEQLQKSIEHINKDLVLIKKADQKKSNKYQKLKNSFKQINQTIKNIHSCQIMFQTNLNTQRTELENYQRLNSNKNHEFTQILQQINQRLQCIGKIDELEENLADVQQKLSIAQYQTQFKTKNDQIVWQKQTYNWFPELFKFQQYKSQIIISQKGTYQIEFVLIGLTTSQNFTGCLCILPSGVNFTKREIQSISCQNSLKFLVQIEEKSFIGVKILYCENEILSRRDVKGLIKIAKF